MSKAKVIAVVVLAVIVVSVVALVAVAPRDGVRPPGEALAVIHLSGVIQSAPAPTLAGGGTITPEVVRTRLDRALQEPRVQAVVLRIDSPGGTVAASQEIAAMVAEHPQPVVVSMGDQAASGGYYVSAPADHIVAQPGTATGSIGVLFQLFDVDELLDKLGIELHTVAAGERKDMLAPGNFDPEAEELLQEQADLMHEQFIDTVAEGRGLSVEEVEELATGELFIGTQAHELGLVDELGGLSEAIAAAEELAGIEDAEIIDLRPTVFEQLFASPGVRSLRSLLDGEEIVTELLLLLELLQQQPTPRFEAS